MLLNLIAVDPGGDTGLASAIYNPDFDGTAHEHIRVAFGARMGEAIQVGGESKQQVLAIHEYIQGQIKRAGDTPAYEVRTVVICEDFNPPSKHTKKSVLQPHKIASMLEFQVWNEDPDGRITWVYQNPGERNVITDQMLRKWKLWQPGKANDDAMAALKHLIVYARKLENNAGSVVG